MRKFVNKALILFVLMFFIVTSTGDKTLSLYSKSITPMTVNVSANVPPTPAPTPTPTPAPTPTPGSVVSIQDTYFDIAIEDGEAIINGMNKDVEEEIKNITIPAQVKDTDGNLFPITTINLIGDSLDDVKTLTFAEPSYITFIGEDSIKNLKKVETIKLPSSLKIIEKGAFQDLNNLKWIVVPKSVVSMEEQSFKINSGNCHIYCEANSKPKGWDSGWNEGGKIHWGKTWKYVDGVPTLN